MLFAQEGAVGLLLSLLDRYGVPTILLGLSLFFLHRAAKWTLKRVIDPLVKSHVELVGMLISTQEEISKGQREMANVQGKVLEILQGLGKQLQ